MRHSAQQSDHCAVMSQVDPDAVFDLRGIVVDGVATDPSTPTPPTLPHVYVSNETSWRIVNRGLCVLSPGRSASEPL